MNQVAPDQASAVHRTNPIDALSSDSLRRRAVRGFVLVVAGVMIIESAPSSWRWLAAPKQAVSVVLDRVGLWQGEWSMFAPEPVINNGWITAEVRPVDGTPTQWHSPYWNEVRSGEKFLRFRHLNYFNRLPGNSYQAARDDFADYLARQSPVPVKSVKLYRSRMRLLMPEDGSLPKRDEVSWMFFEELVAHRTYPPNDFSPRQPESQVASPNVAEPVDSQRRGAKP